VGELVEAGTSTAVIDEVEHPPDHHGVAFNQIGVPPRADGLMDRQHSLSRDDGCDPLCCRAEVLLNDGNLILRGEMKSETEDKERQFSERFYGRFERQIPVGIDIDENKVEASFKNGVLKVVLPKTERAQTKAKRIAINNPTKH